MKRVRAFLLHFLKAIGVLAGAVAVAAVLSVYVSYPLNERAKDRKLVEYLTEESKMTGIYGEMTNYSKKKNERTVIISCYDMNEERIAELYSLKEPLIKFLNENGDKYLCKKPNKVNCEFHGYIESYEYENGYYLSSPGGGEYIVFTFSLDNPDDVLLGVHGGNDENNRTNILKSRFEEVTSLYVDWSKDFDITMLQNFPDLREVSIINEKDLTIEEVEKYLPVGCRLKIEETDSNGESIWIHN